MAKEVLHRAYEWHESRSPGDAGSESGRFDLAQTLYQDGRLEEAKGLVEELAAEFPQNVDYLGYLGAIAARQEDRETADQITARLRDFEQPYLRGQHTLWRARIASLLGEKDAALGLLREAIAQGHSYGPWQTADLDFQPLWDFPPYQELMRPKG
jgi:predicted Zn-dependent protease